MGAFGRAGEVEEVARGISEASAEPRLLDDLMVRALGDRSARVLWSAGPGHAGFVDSDGFPYQVSDASGWWPVGSPEPVGALSYDRTLIADTGVVATIVAPLELAIDHRRLVVDLRSAMQRLDEAAEEIPDVSPPDRRRCGRGTPPHRSRPATTVCSNASCSPAWRYSGSGAARRILSWCGPWRSG